MWKTITHNLELGIWIQDLKDTSLLQYLLDQD